MRILLRLLGFQKLTEVTGALVFHAAFLAYWHGRDKFWKLRFGGSLRCGVTRGNRLPSLRCEP